MHINRIPFERLRTAFSLSSSAICLSQSITVAAQYLGAAGRRWMSKMASSSSSSMNGFDMQNFTSTMPAAMKQLNSLASALPTGADLKFQRTLSRSAGKKVDKLADRLLSLTSQALELAQPKGKGKQRLSHDDLVEAYQSSVVSVTDGLLEGIDSAIDDHKRKLSRLSKGKSREKAPVALPPAVVNEPSNAQPGARLPYSMLYSSMPKSQRNFLDAVNNARNAVFVPLVNVKPHSSRPLSLQPLEYFDREIGTSRKRIPNPFAAEIDEAVQQPLPKLPQSRPSDALMADAMTTKPFTFVTTVDALKECISHLKTAAAIAIDLEHHNHRSFRGFTSLVQISTDEQDFVIDPLVPELRANLQLLNSVTTDPRIVKVLHGAESDIIWLQRDFGVYVVNLFDTYPASRALGRTTGHSLASLLTQYTHFTADKRYQMADWRIRPLPDEMLRYARSDTHFLLHIFRRLLNDPSMTPDKLAAIRKDSAETAKQVYEHLGYDIEGGKGANGWYGLLEKTGKLAIWGHKVASDDKSTWVDRKGTTAFHVFCAVHDWRDQVARQADESMSFFLPNKAVFAIAENPPTTLPDLSKLVDKDLRNIGLQQRQDLLSVIVAAKKKADALIQVKLNAAKETELTKLQSNTVSWEDDPWLEKAAQSYSKLFPQLPPASSSAPSSFADIINKVHEDLLKHVEASAVPSPPIASVKVKVEVPVDEPMASIVEVANTKGVNAAHATPLLPQEQKPVALNGVYDDSEIVQTSKRKRKAESSAKRVKAETPDVKPFDYSKTVSILDMPPPEADADGVKPKKQRKDKSKAAGSAEEYTFGKAPKPMNQPKSGNRSHTFL